LSLVTYYLQNYLAVLACEGNCDVFYDNLDNIPVSYDINFVTGGWIGIKRFIVVFMLVDPSIQDVYIYYKFGSLTA
jgi:hypothetical protein